MDAVRALPDTESVSFDIPSETFTVDLAAGGRAEAVLAAIRELGYQPELLDQAPAAASPSPRIGTPTAPSLRGALARAGERGVPLVVDFGGAFCSACQAFRRDVLTDGRVRRALEGYELLEVDVEEDPAAASDLGVTAVPDIWILSGDGTVLGRENRSLGAEEFLGLLRRHAPR